ncbi:MAG: hypothetical protein ACRESY_10780, partial [Steroidobacteraceae bacterium]
MSRNLSSHGLIRGAAGWAVIVGLGALAVLAGCALIGSHPLRKPDAEAVVPAAPPAPKYAQPVDTHK